MASRSFRDYGEAVIKHLENTVDSDHNLQKAPVNYEGVSVTLSTNLCVYLFRPKKKTMTAQVSTFKYLTCAKKLHFSFCSILYWCCWMFHVLFEGYNNRTNMDIMGCGISTYLFTLQSTHCFCHSVDQFQTWLGLDFLIASTLWFFFCITSGRANSVRPIYLQVSVHLTIWRCFIMGLRFTFFHITSENLAIQQVRVSGHGGWFLLRLSLHDPVLPLNIEVGRRFLLCFLNLPFHFKVLYVIWI